MPHDKKSTKGKSSFSTKLPLIDKEIKESNDDIIAVIIMMNDECLCLTMHFSQAVQKFSLKNVSQYPPKSQTMNTICLTLILASVLVANATAASQLDLTLVTSSTVMINCITSPVDVTVGIGERHESGLLEFNIKAAEKCIVDTVATSISNREGTNHVDLYRDQFPRVFENVSLLFLIPSPGGEWPVVAAWI